MARRFPLADEVGKSLPTLVQSCRGKELETVLTQPLYGAKGAVSISEPAAGALKSKSRQALGNQASARTIDYCIANHGIRVTRIGRVFFGAAAQPRRSLKQGIPEVRLLDEVLNYGSYPDLGFSKFLSSYPAC